VSLHYNNLRLDGYAKQLPRNLETKWAIIKHNVSKFVGVYGSVISLNELGSFIEDTLHKALELYKLKHSKNLELCFIHCWLLLKDVPRWSYLLEDFKKTLAMKRPCPYVQKVGPKELEADDFSVEVIVLAMPSQGGRIMK
jgi:hypothetical protein